MCILGDREDIVLNHKKISVDKCIVPYVKALNTNGITTSISCCGHGEIDGSIITYLNGEYRLVIICPPGEESRKRFKEVYQPSQEAYDNVRIRGNK